MPDRRLELIDEMYERGANAIRICVFDKRVLLPLSQLPDAVQGETGEVINQEGLRARASEGWFPLLTGAGIDGCEDGVPLYVPSRVGLYLKLEREGYSGAELRDMAELEEWSIDNVCAAEELAYVDDDLETLILHAEARLEAIQSPSSAGTDDIDRARKEVSFLHRLRETGVSEVLRPVIEKGAFRVRTFNEATRWMLVEMDRSKVKAGYSPDVVCSSHGWNSETGFRCDGVLWRQTVRVALSRTEAGSTPAIRVPGFVLRGDLVVPTRTMRPADYSSQWKRHEIDEYLGAWAEVRGEKRCLNCYAELPAGNERKRFCGEKCRSAARQRRFRERNPDAVERAQKRYWDSIDLGEGQ